MSPYVYDHPVSGSGAFHGRQSMLRSLLRGVLAGRSFAICSGPRLGRSSVLQQLAYLLYLRWTREPTALKLVPVFHDLGANPAGGARLLWRDLWQELSSAILNPRVFGESEPVRLPKVDFQRRGDPWEVFQGACCELWDRLSGTAGWCRTVLFLEQGDQLWSRQLEPAIQPLAYLMGTRAPWAPAAVVMSGGRVLRECLWDTHSPLSFLRVMLLGVFSESEAAALVRAGLPEVDDAWIEELLHLTGRHPYLLSRLLAEVEKVGPSEPFEQLCDAAGSDVDELFQAIWNDLDFGRGVTYRGAYAAPEHALLQYLIDYGREADVRTAERDLGIKPLREHIEFLEYVGVVERVLRGDQICFRPQCDLWNGWYSQRILV